MNVASENEASPYAVVPLNDAEPSKRHSGIVNEPNVSDPKTALSKTASSPKLLGSTSPLRPNFVSLPNEQFVKLALEPKVQLMFAELSLLAKTASRNSATGLIVVSLIVDQVLTVRARASNCSVIIDLFRKKRSASHETRSSLLKSRSDSVNSFLTFAEVNTKPK